MSSRLIRLTGSLLFAGLWGVVAAIRPTTTFHLAPIIVAAWPGLGEPGSDRAIVMALVGGLIAVSTTGLLSAAGLLMGPSLLPWGGAALESVVGSLIGALIGIAPSIRGGLEARSS